MPELENRNGIHSGDFVGTSVHKESMVVVVTWRRMEENTFGVGEV